MTEPVSPTPSPTPATVSCGHCGASVAVGRFCAACGKELGLHATAGGVISDALGVKQVPLRAYGRTAWLAVMAPADLSDRWMKGQRIGLVSPIAMMGAVTLLTAFVGFFLTRWTGVRQATGGIDYRAMMEIAPFLKDRFPTAANAAALNREELNSQFQQVGGWFAAFWPSLLIAPGWLSLMPWRRIDQRGALIFAVVESVFLLMLAGLHTALSMAAPAIIGATGVGLLFAAAVFAHGAVHVRGLIGASWSYALTRPLLAALWILPVAYLWVVFILTLTLAAWA